MEEMTAASKRRGKRFWKRNTGLLYILPWLAGFLVFKLYPFASSLFYSFTDYVLRKGETITSFGVFNYVEFFTNEDMMRAFGVTFKYAFITVPLKLIFALFIAYILAFKIKGVGLFRTAYYIPSILGGSVAVAVLWTALFQKQGIINRILEFIGIEGPSWLGDERYALLTICFLRIWQFGSAMVIFLAALKNIPSDLYEAAAIDGAGKWKQFFRITVPMITPSIFYNLIMQLVQAFQEFNGPYIVTKGGPNQSTTLISLLIYGQAFQRFNMGMASAMAWIMFVVVAILSLIAFKSQEKWVYYAD
ncbi:MAG TPA: sugar ABC transporter permease [Candidatus Acetatifactor stercoripullorum]|uniref:Sugar ABC transporter permease n=1 Tax=Candidatus Acetatifactor stercoripullorum TaxID=2838414 RepID=A0A9D1UAS4_9FIRM|nr:sugar ABC transporter permease [uncultured Acetatifactor sp.]HIW80937.1 sugar ABC transporter permease [Candidatus Acetatifactor stercoripullorum]